jgi:hypothetical protein
MSVIGGALVRRFASFIEVAHSGADVVAVLFLVEVL